MKLVKQDCETTDGDSFYIYETKYIEYDIVLLMPESKLEINEISWI